MCTSALSQTTGNFYPRPPRGGRLQGCARQAGEAPISIHALREEGDRQKVRAPCKQRNYFYPRPPRGGRLLAIREIGSRTSISIHALREEGDSTTTGRHGVSTSFLSTPSARRATFPAQRNSPRSPISIHALREEGDRSPRTSWHWTKQFLSTPSVRRATAETDQWDYMPALFLSTPSARRATKLFCKDGEVSAISIHALREEGDRAKMELSRNQNNFYPRPPRGGRLTGGTTMAGIFKISIHALREEGDCLRRGICLPRPEISIHALREEGDPRTQSGPSARPTFLSTPSARRATATPGR